MVDKLDLRGGIEKMREVAQLLNGWANDMERSLGEPPATAGGGSIAGGEVTRNKRSVRRTVAPIEGADKNAPDEPASVPPEQSDPPAVTFDQVRSILAAKCAAGYRTQVQALINSYGATRFSEVDPSRYAELVEAAGLLGGDADAG